MTVQYRLTHLLDLHVLPEYVKPNNPNFAALEASYVAWIDAADFLSAPHKQAWKKAELALLIARTFPDSDLAHLRVCLDWMMLFLVLERLTDTPATSIESKKWTEVFMGLLSGNDELEGTKGPALVMKHLASKFMPEIQPPFRDSFIASNQVLANGVHQEVLDRESAEPVTIAAYSQTRRASVGIAPFIELARWTFDIDLPTEVLEHPIIVEMNNATLDMGGLANDLYSYRKEYLEDGALHNYITVSMKDPSVPVVDGDHQAAIDYATEQFSRILARFVECQAQLPALFPSELQGKLDRYAESLLDLVVGSIQWSVSCKRYSLFEDEKSKLEGIVVIE